MGRDGLLLALRVLLCDGGETHLRDQRFGPHPPSSHHDGTFHAVRTFSLKADGTQTIILLYSLYLYIYMGVWLSSDDLLVGVEQHADGAVRRLGAHALVVLPLFLQVGRSVLPQVSQRFSPALPLQPALLHPGRLLRSL